MNLTKKAMLTALKNRNCSTCGKSGDCKMEPVSFPCPDYLFIPHQKEGKA